MHVKLSPLPRGADRQPAVRRQRRCFDVVLDQIVDAEQAFVHSRAHVLRGELEAALARRVKKRDNEFVGAGGPSERLLQRGVFEDERAEGLKLRRTGKGRSGGLVFISMGMFTSLRGVAHRGRQAGASAMAGLYGAGASM